MKNNKKSVLGLNIFIIILALIYAVVLIIGNVWIKKASVAVIPGSYAETYAKDNKLNVVSLSDSQTKYFDQRYESFDYNIDESGNIELKNYSGKSTDLVVPAEIGGKQVTMLSESFIASLKSVKNLYISPYITAIIGDPDPSVIIHCVDSSPFYRMHKDDGWSFELSYDSDFVNFMLGDIPFEYNRDGDSIEISRYNGNDDLVVIPSYIDGCPVTDVNIDLVAGKTIYVIPNTVKNIIGSSVKYIYSATFAIELFFTILAFAIALIMINIILPRYRKDDSEYLLSGNQMIAIVLYVLAQTIFGILVTYFRYCQAYLALIISLIILAVFVALMMLGGAGRKHVKAVSENIKAKTSRMDSIKEMSKGLADDIKDPKLRKKVQRVIDEIRYSDPVSREDLDDLESNIERALFELRNRISVGDEKEIYNLTNELLNIVKERNIRCKDGK